MIHRRIFVLSVFVVSSCFCQEEFHCKPKPGCQIAQCEASQWGSPGFDLKAHLEKKQFPLTCTSLRKVEDFEERNEMIESQKTEINKLKEDLEGLRKLVTTSQNENDALRQENRNQDNKIAKLIAGFEVMKEKLTELEESVTDAVKETNDAVKEEDADTNKVCEGDDFRFKDSCYWSEMQQKISFHEAKSICNKRGSSPAYPVDNALYDVFMKRIRENMLSEWTFAWLGLRYDPSSGDVTLSNGRSAPYVQWAENKPSGILPNNKVYLGVWKDAESSENGMAVGQSSWKLNGVICQYKLL